MNLDVRLRRLERLIHMRERIVRIAGSLEAARQDPQWENINTLINVIRSRISRSLDQPDIEQPLTQQEIAMINSLLSQMKDL